MEECNKTHNETTFGWVLALQRWAKARAVRKAQRATAAVSPPRPPVRRLLVPR